MNVLNNDDFGDIEARLRRDLAPLADAIMEQSATTTVDLATASDTEPIFNNEVGSFPTARRSRRWLVAAAVVLAIGAAAALWQVVDSADRTETGPITPGPSEETSAEAQWFDLPPAPEGVLSRGHMVSVWTGEEALFWGGRTEEGNPVSGGVAYNPATDSWREIESPEWGHPGATGVYLDGWIYVSAKDSVIRFDPQTGVEEEVLLDARLGWPLDVATDGTEVLAFGRTPDGLGFQVMSPTVGELRGFEDGQGLNTNLNAALTFGDGQISALGWERNEFVVTLPDQSSWALSLSETATATRFVAPPSAPGDSRVELVDTSNGPLVVHLRDDGGTDIESPVDDTGWGYADGLLEFDKVKVVGAGEWVAVLQPGLPPSLSAPPDQGTASASAWVGVEPPPDSLHPNAVWTGSELIVWGGNPPLGPDTPPVGWRITVPSAALHRSTEPVGEGEEAVEDATDSVDEIGFETLARLLSELPDEERIPTGPYDEVGHERFDYQWTDEGLWVYSQPEPAKLGPASGGGEILLLADWGGPILDSWPLGYFPGGYRSQIEVTDDGVYCMSVGDGGLPDSVFCRIDRRTGETSLVVHPSEIDGGDESYYADFFGDSGIDWRVVPPGAPGAVRPFGWLYLDGDGAIPTVVDEFALVRFDPETLDPFEVVDLATTDEQIYPCPLGDEAVPELEDFGLPPAARATRQAIFDAAIACDIGTLEELSGGQLTVPKSDGGWGMVALAAMLTLPPDVVEGGELEGDQIVYLFPSASALTTPFEFDAVSRFYGPSGDDHLTIIGADGTWFPISG